MQYTRFGFYNFYFVSLRMYDVQIVVLLIHFHCMLSVNVDLWIAMWIFFGYTVINVHAIRFDPSFVIYKIVNYLHCHLCLNVYRQAVYVWNCHLCFKGGDIFMVQHLSHFVLQVYHGCFIASRYSLIVAYP